MERRMIPVIVAGLVLAASPAAASPATASGAMDAVLSVGEPAPPFSLPGSDGKTYSLEEFRGKRAVVIAWFPKAFTGG